MSYDVRYATLPLLFFDYLSWLKRNGLVEVQGDIVKLRGV